MMIKEIDLINDFEIKEHKDLIADVDHILLTIKSMMPSGGEFMARRIQLEEELKRYQEYFNRCIRIREIQSGKMEDL